MEKAMEKSEELNELCGRAARPAPGEAQPDGLTRTVAAIAVAVAELVGPEKSTPLLDAAAELMEGAEYGNA